MKKNKNNKINLKRTFKNNAYVLSLVTKACPGILVAYFLNTVLGSVYNIVLNVYLYKYALNALQMGKELKTIVIVLVCMFAYAVVYSVVRRLMNFYIEIKGARLEEYVNTTLQRKAAEIDLIRFENSDFYDTYVKAREAAMSRIYSVIDSLFNVMWVVINITAIGGLIISIDPIFLLIAVIPLIYTLIFGKKRNRLKYDYDMKTQEMARQRDYVRRTFYLRDFSKEMRLTEMYRVMFKRMRTSISEMKNIVRQYGYKLMLFNYLHTFIFQVIVYSGSIVLATFKTLVSKTMLLGDCFVVINSIENVANSINYMGNVFFKLDENSLYIENLRSFLEYEVIIAEDEGSPCVSRFEKLELKNVTFSYSENAAPALLGVNMTVKAGERIAIVGHNGAGKTTLVKLLLRLYDTTDGEILCNGENIKTYRLSSYRGLFGTVFQDYQLFATTVAENVMLRGNITDEDRENVIQSLEKSGVYDKILSLPNGIDSNVTKEFDPDGAVFSGGEAQKISIARIFAGGSEIVIMDEPTSALDPIAEQKMYQNMFDACNGKTVIFISHRLSSATMADCVYMFENGKIVERGTHSHLLSLDGKYAEMWHKQADSYADAEEVAE